jgi:DNA polymerase III subunit delta'
MSRASLWDIPGQRRAAEVLRGAVARDEPGHAWAFLGPSGVGQEEAARALAAALNCPTPSAPGEPCGVCSVCSRCRRGAFPAYHEFAPTGSMHRVEEVRKDWLATAALSPLEGRVKVLRVIDADRMNEASANAFLKGLEEPPPGTIWLLDIADPDELPDTVLSRCRALRFAPWGPDELAAEARRLGLAGEDVAIAVRVASGAPAVLRRLARPGGLDDLRAHRSILAGLRERGPGYALVAAQAIDEEVKRATKALKAEGEAELAELAEGYGDAFPQGVERQLKERFARREREVKLSIAQAALDDLVAWCRDAVLVGVGGPSEALLHVDALPALRADAEALGPARLLAAIDHLLATREHLERNVGQQLALEACCMELSALILTPSGR